MDVVLVSIAGLSLILAVAMGVILFNVLREERRRSDARVAVLTAASTLDPVVDLATPDFPADLRRAAAPGAARSDLFMAAEEPSPWARRVGVAGALAAAVAVAGYLLAPWPPAHSTLPVAAATTVNAPLELLTMRHEQDGAALKISGLVHNPRTGSAVSQVFVTAILFSPDGSFITSGRAALDFTTLAPGDESPFVLTLPVTTAVARYRVGFRNADGSVIAHVDRRAGDSAARNAQDSGSTPWVR